MAKTARQSNGATTSNDAAAGPPTAPITLDQDEVMRMMMAARKGKERDMTPSDDTSDNEGSDEEESEDSQGNGSGSEDDAQSSGDEEDARQHSGSDDGEAQDDASSSASGPSTSRSLKAARNKPSFDTSTSRVKLAAAQPAQPTPSKSPFDTAKAASTTFAALGLSTPLISALAGINIKKPTEIQSACVGPILEGRDCIGGAKTGSGKTMAFALPIVERIARDPYGIWAVVLTPTRELAYQLTEQFLVVGKPLGLKTVTIVGGMDMMRQARELDARPHVIVATPGRLCDLMRSDGMGQNKLSRVKTLVLDEADRMLTPTFAPELSYLFSQIPKDRQTCLFTATVSDAIMELANKPPQPGKKKPFVYRVASETATVANLKQKYLFIPSQIRDPYLYYLLHNPPSDIDSSLRIAPKPKPEPKPRKRNQGKKRRRPESDDDDDGEAGPQIPSTIIFTQRCATAHLLHLLLTQLEIPSVPLHSHLTQPQRLESLARFRARDVPVLVTTDVGSRGLDIPSVAMVINWDCPRRSDDYVHRVGRTARAGRGGVAVTVVTERDVELVQKIEGEIGVTLEEMELPEETVLEKLNAVSLARRMATMEMHDTGFGERQATNKAKAVKRARRDAARS